MVDLLENVHALYVLVLTHTGFLARLSALDLATPASDRPAWAAVLVTSGVLLLFGALASGEDTLVRTFRAAAFVLATTLPLLALRLAGTPHLVPFTGLVLLVLLVAGLVHRVLHARRKESLAAIAILRTRWALEILGVVLFAGVAGLALAGREVPLRLAFWALFLIRVSTADLLAPTRLAVHTGFDKSAFADLKSAVRTAKKPSRRKKAASRARSGLAGLGKLILIAVWLVLPLLAAVAPQEVAYGVWPRTALFLKHYPPWALAFTAVVIFAISVRDIADEPIDGLRGMTASTATLLYLAYIYQDPAFEAYRGSLPGLYLVETLSGFLLGAARKK